MWIYFLFMRSCWFRVVVWAVRLITLWVCFVLVFVLLLLLFACEFALIWVALNRCFVWLVCLGFCLWVGLILLALFDSMVWCFDWDLWFVVCELFSDLILIFWCCLDVFCFFFGLCCFCLHWLVWLLKVKAYMFRLRLID